MTIVPESLNEQNEWSMKDQIRMALHQNDNIDLPKKFRRDGNTRLMNTGQNMLAAAKRRKELEKLLLQKKKTKLSTK